MKRKPMMHVDSLLWVVLMPVLFLAGNVKVYGIDCDVTSTGLVPINDLGTGLYLGQFEGGLYPGGSNTAPPMHEAEGIARATSGIQPLDTNGVPSPDGAYVLISVGMSNTTQEF